MRRVDSSLCRASIAVVLILFLVRSSASFAQSTGLKCQTFTGYHYVIAEKGVIDPSTMILTPKSKFSFDPFSYKLTLDTAKSEAPVEHLVCYRALSLPRKQSYFHLPTSLYDSTIAFQPLSAKNVRNPEKEELLYTPDIFKAGSLTRGVSFGNSQNVNVTSAFNFQMEGKLSHQLNIRADITDQKVPFQPEGNTANLREFDHVGIEVYNDHLSLKAGDLMLKNPTSNFLKFQKNVLGVNGAVMLNKDSVLRSKSSISVGSAKGQFADLTLQAVEGLQGPYQFQGTDGQRYFVILANSEKVYIDGQLLARGARHDYIIDYNLGELTFMPSVMITQYTRMRVTFEYSDQNYSRSIVSASQELEFDRSTVSLAIYQEKDNKNKPTAFDLTPSDQLQMSLAGDEHLPVLITNVKIAPSNSQLIAYVRDSVQDVDGAYHAKYVYSADSLVTRYIVPFSDVGAGNGNYQLSISDVNGRIYEWIDPIDNEPQGQFEPVQFIAAPSSRAMLELSANHRWSDHMSSSLSFAMSSQDENLYSPIGNHDNSGVAVKAGFLFEDLTWQLMPKSNIKLTLDFEHDTENFMAIDRFRSIEFDRNWGYNVELDSIGRADNIINSSLEIARDEHNRLKLGFTSRTRETVINGYQQFGELKKSFGSLHAEFDYSLLKNENASEEAQWHQWTSTVECHKFGLIPGYKVTEDRNEVYDIGREALSRTAMNYFSQEFYIRNADSSSVQYLLNYKVREDRAIQDGELRPFLKSKTLSSSIRNPQAKRHRLDVTFSYRDLSYLLPTSGLEDEQLILGRLNWQGAMFNKTIRTDLSYTTASSREILREFVFIEVASGEGTHAWRDLNQDGIQDLTEFFEAVNFDERLYIKVYVPTTDFVNAFNTVFIFSLNAGFPRVWSQQAGGRKWLSKFSNRTSLNLNKKNTDSEFASRFNPFHLSPDNEELIFTRDAFRSILFYNKSGKGLAFDLGYFNSHSKQVVSNGLDSRSSKEWTINVRLPLSREFTLKTLGLQSQKNNKSAYQEERNFQIASYELVPALVWQPQSNLRLNIDVRQAVKDGKSNMELEQKTELAAVTLGGRWTKGGSNALNANFAWTEIKYDGELNTAMSYEMLEALQPGTNYSWQINFNHKLLSGLQLNLSYNGRQSAHSKVVHMGSMQFTALF